VVTLNNTYSGADAGNYNIVSQTNTTANITAKALTISGITAADKVYDGCTTASVNTSGVSSTSMVAMGLVAGDTVTVSSIGTFTDKNVNTSKVVTLSSSFTGTDVANYNITAQANTTANITAKALTISGITAANKVYDGNTSASVNMSAVNNTTLVAMGLVAGDDFSISTTGVFSDASIGRSKTVTLSSTYGGTALSNYNVTSQLSALADITGSGGGGGGGASSSSDNDAMTSQRALSMIAQLDRNTQSINVYSNRAVSESTPRSSSATTTQPTLVRAASSGVLPVAVIEDNRMSNLGMTYEQQPNDIHIQLTTAPAALPPSPTMLRFSGNFKTFMVMNERGEMVPYQGAMIGKRMVILADTESAKRLARVDMQTVLAAAITTLGSDQPITLSEIESVVMDLR
jgi:hypothetical protein